MGIFRFKRFDIDDSGSAMKIGTDGVLLGAWACADGAETVIDIGCGTGLIALMMAQRYDAVRVIGVEIDESACADALRNVAASPWKDRVEVVHGDALQYDLNTGHASAEGLLHGPLCIVSNPPFYTEALRSPDAARALARHGNGLCVESLIALSAGLLRMVGGTLSFIAPAGQDDDIQYALALHRMATVRITDVVTRAGREPARRLYEVACDTEVSIPCQIDELVIRDSSGVYTDAYVSLTEQYYIKL